MIPKVTLLAYTPNPMQVMASAARLCYSRDTDIADIIKNMDSRTATELLVKCLERGHHSVLEHAYFTFGVEGVSRNASHQVVRHRNTSFSEQSRHYTVQRKPPLVAEPKSPEFQKFKKRWEDAVKLVHALYVEMVDAGIPRQDARHILPGGMETKLVMSANLRQWLHYVEVRACSVNCEEALLTALAIRRKLVRLLPFINEYMGPPCKRGACPEGERSCGHPWLRHA